MGGKSIKVVPLSRARLPNHSAMFPGVAIQEIRSATARQRAVSSSSSSEGMQIVGEVLVLPAPTLVGFLGPRTRSHKRPQLVYESEEDEGLSSHLICKKEKVRASPEQPNLEQGDSALNCFHSTLDLELSIVPSTG